MKDTIRKEQGITLTALVIYIIVLVITMGILASISGFFYSNMMYVDGNSKTAAEFSKFNMYFVEDVKNNSDAQITVNEKDVEILFDDNNLYTYVSNQKSIYRNKEKIAKDVSTFSVVKEENTDTDSTKKILKVLFVSGEAEEGAFNKTISYVLKYW